VEHYRQFLEGRPFQVITDHTTLKSLMKMENPPALYARWIMKLQPYDIDVVYKKGRLHGNADSMSCHPDCKSHHPNPDSRHPKCKPRHHHPKQDKPSTKEVTFIEKLRKGCPFTELI
jgi:hypothetical protein